MAKSKIDDKLGIFKLKYQISEQDEIITIHSDESETRNSIPIRDEIKNTRLNQIFASRGPYKVKIEQIDKRQMFHIQIPYADDSTKILLFFREYLVPNVNYALYTDDDNLYKQFCQIYCNTYNNNGPNIVRYLQKRAEVKDEELLTKQCQN